MSKEKIYRLEYRLLDEEKDYPLLYQYDDISAQELALRLSCGRFVKEGHAYEKTSAACEFIQYVIYLRPAELLLRTDWPEVRRCEPYFELRRLTEKKGEAPLLNSYALEDEKELQLILLCDYQFFLGEERLVEAIEMDEDRACYICYLGKKSEEDEDEQRTV